MLEITTADTRAEQINQEHMEARKCLGDAVIHAIEAGRLLEEVKSGLAHGEWLPWLAANVDFSARTAQVYLRMHDRREELPNAQRVALLPMRQAVRLLAEPKPAISPQPTASAPMAPDDAKYLPAESSGLVILCSDRGQSAKPGGTLLVHIGSSTHTGYFYVTRAVRDCSYGISFDGTNRPLLAIHAVKMAREWLKNESEEDLVFETDKHFWGDPSPWDFNHCLYDKRADWLEYGMGIRPTKNSPQLVTR